MTTRLYPSLPAAVGLLVMSLWTTQANAQSSASAASPANLAAPATPEPTALPAYRSALEGYQRYTEEKMVNWKEANDATARIGGWRAYAREASQPQAPEGADQLDSAAMPAKP